MTKQLTDYLRDGEPQQLAEAQEMRRKSRLDAAYYGAVIKQIMDRARARRKAKGEDRV
jgi:hypothetical protein